MVFSPDSVVDGGTISCRVDRLLAVLYRFLFVSLPYAQFPTPWSSEARPVDDWRNIAYSAQNASSRRILANASAVLENYNFLTLRREMRETNVYAGPNGGGLGKVF